MRAAHRFRVYLFEDLLVAKDLRSRIADGCVLNQDPRTLRGLVGRAGRRNLLG
jgi:hypothetical protein